MADFPHTEKFLNTFIRKYSPNSNPPLPCDLKSHGRSNRYIPRDSNVEEVKQKLDDNKIVNILGIGGCGKSTVARLFIVGNKYHDEDEYFNKEKNKYKEGFKSTFEEITDIIINTDDVYKEFCVRFVEEYKICSYIYQHDNQPNYEKTFDSLLKSLNKYSTTDGKKNLFVLDVNETANYEIVKSVIKSFKENCSSNWKMLVVSRECLCDTGDDYIDISRVDEIDSDFIHRLFFDRLESNIRPYYQKLTSMNSVEFETVFTKLGNLPILIRALAEYLNSHDPLTVPKILEELGDGNLTEEFKCRSLNKDKVYESIGNFLGKLSIFKNLDNDIQKRIVSTMMLWDADYFSQSFISRIVFNNCVVNGFVPALNTLVDKCWLDLRRDENYNLEYKMHSLIAKNSRHQVFEEDENIKYRDFSCYLQNIERINKLEDKERNALCTSLSNFNLTTDSDYLLRQAHNFQREDIYQRALKIKLLKIKTPAITDVEIFDILTNNTEFCKTSVDELYYSWLKDAPDYQNDPKQQFTVNGKVYKMIKVPNGEFFMGAQNKDGKMVNYDKYANSDEAPVHKVILDSFFLSETQVTQVLWKGVMQEKMDNPSIFGQGDDFPVENVSWYDCLAFIMELNHLTKLKFRLPTEAQWEYAAGWRKNGKRNIFSGTSSKEKLGYYAWYGDNTTHKVADRFPNELGIYDMSGNVWEWCQDWYDDYPKSPVTDPPGPVSGSHRVLRGGSWFRDAAGCRVSCRCRGDPGSRDYCYGFRLSLRSQQKKE